MKERCKGCIYYEVDNEEKVTGDCHRYPPSESINSQFPHLGQSEWCGEYKEVKDEI